MASGVFLTVVLLLSPSLPVTGTSASGATAVNPCVQQISVWFRGPGMTRMIKVSWRESRWQENPKPWRNAKGCLQVSWSAHAAELRRLGITPADLGIASVNVAYSRLLFARSGWAPWKETA